MTEFSGQNLVIWHVFLCFAFPGNSRSPPQPIAQSLDDPTDNPDRIAIEFDQYLQPAGASNFISFQDSVLRCCDLGYAGVRVLQEIQLYRSGRTGIGLGDAKFLAGTRRVVWLAVAADSAGRVFADHANRIFPKTGQTVRSRPLHNRTRNSGHTNV